MAHTIVNPQGKPYTSEQLGVTVRHFKYEPGDQVQDFTFDPPISGVVTAKAQKPDAYLVRLRERATDVVIHARNLRKV